MNIYLKKLSGENYLGCNVGVFVDKELQAVLHPDIFYEGNATPAGGEFLARLNAGATVELVEKKVKGDG